MGMFDVAEEMPSEGAIRGLTGEMAEEADKAIADGKVRKALFNEVSEKAVGAIKRYLAQQGWGCKVRTVGGQIHWQVVEKKEITPEHKQKMLDALDKARKAKEATKAQAAATAANGAAAAPAAAPAASKPEEAAPTKGQGQTAKAAK